MNTEPQMLFGHTASGTVQFQGYARDAAEVRHEILRILDKVETFPPLERPLVAEAVLHVLSVYGTIEEAPLLEALQFLGVDMRVGSAWARAVASAMHRNNSGKAAA